MTIKPIISEKISLIDYLPNYNCFDVYLAYVKTRGYILINYSGSRYWFKSFECKTLPSRFYLDYNKESIYKEMINTIKDYLKPYETYMKNEENKFPYEIEEKIDEVSLDVFDSLAEDVKDKFLSDSFIGLSDFNNRQMKDFILKPIRTFNNYINYEKNNYSVSIKEANEIKLELEQKVYDLVEYFNSSLKYYTSELLPDGNSINKPVIKNEKKFYDIFIKSVNDVYPSHILNLKVGNFKLSKTEGALELASVFNIKKTLKDDHETVYYYNESNEYYEEITAKGLKNLIYKVYGFNLTEPDLNSIYKSIPFEDRLYNNILVFNNCLFNTDTLTKVEGIYNRRDYLTVNKIGFKENNKINLLDFDNYKEPLEVKDILAIKEHDESSTLTERTLREILIPKSNKEDISLFKDYLQRTGAKILGRNIFKGITFYFTEYSNSGKTVLNYLNELLFNKKNISINANTFEDKSFFKNFEGALAINIDEIDENSFNDLKPELKRISSQYAKMDIRNMYAESRYTIEEFPEITIYSNVKLKLDPVEDYAMFERIDFLNLPNRFVSEKEIDEFNNAYLKNDNLFDDLKNDKKGLNWLITASIKCFKEMIENNERYYCKQTTAQSVDVYLEGNHITKFLMLYTEEADLIKNDFVHVKTIQESFKQYMKMEGIELTKSEEKNLPRNIGKEICKLYHISNDDKNKKDRDSIGIKYSIKLKDIGEVHNTEFKQAYEINEENISDLELNQLKYLKQDDRLIYEEIKKGTNTINLLMKEYPDIDVYNIVKYLDEKNLIINTGTANITEA